jgi:hypothetical protein
MLDVSRVTAIVVVSQDLTPAHALTAPAGYKAALATSFSRLDVGDVTLLFAITAPSRMVAVAGNVRLE